MHEFSSEVYNPPGTFYFCGAETHMKSLGETQKKMGSTIIQQKSIQEIAKTILEPTSVFFNQS